jgi:hypothetical protein
MIKAYNTPQTKTEDRSPRPARSRPSVEGQWQVPADKMPEFTAAWKAVGDEEIEVDVQPIPLAA